MRVVTKNELRCVYKKQTVYFKNKRNEFFVIYKIHTQ